MSQFDYGSIAPKVMGLIAGATVSLDPTLGCIFVVQPNEAETINATSPGFPGQQFTFRVDTLNATTRNITFGTNFRSTGVLATGAVANIRFNIRFESDGIGWSELGRTPAQA